MDDKTLAAPLEAEGAALDTTGSGELATDLPGSGVRHVLGGRYEILGLLGVGGMGSVYRARDRELEEVVALKMLQRDVADAPGMLERFRREVRLARRITHPNVARVFDIGEHEGDRFLTMELVEGEPLASLLAREGALPVSKVIDMACAVCAGLEAAHAAGVVHRDLKPDNVLLGKAGRVALTDFGIARALVRDQDAAGGKTLGAAVGTPAYMAPEQVEGAPDIDHRADIYALGAMLYEMLTGQRAWRGDSPFAVAAARLLADPPDARRARPDLPDALGRLVLRCMARSREARFASAGAVADELATLTQPAPALSIAPAAPAPRAPPLPAPTPDGKSVAVLPFRNQGGEDDAYLADELTDDLIDTLSMTPGLRVRPRGVVMRFRDAEQDPRDIGRELGVQVVVEGAARRRGGAVRITARLISVSDGFQLWAKRFDRREEEVLRINDEVAQAIAEALTVAAAAPSRQGPADALALELFLRGRHEYRRFWAQHVERALELFGRALERAPDDPMILSAEALARARLWFFRGLGGEEAERAATRAVTAAPDLPDARLALASVRLQQGDVINAVRQLCMAVARGPSLSDAHSNLGCILLEVGAVEEGVRRVEAALSLDPQAPQAAASLARTYGLLGMWPESEAAMARIRDLDVDASHLFIRARFALWHRDAARGRELRAAVPEETTAYRFTRAMLDTLIDGRLPAEMPGFEGALNDQAPRRKAFVWQIQAEAAGLLGRAEEALDALERAVREGFHDFLWLERCPILDVVRADPRYGAMHAVVARRAAAAIAAYREG